jgi:hypothetical protein
MRLCCWLSRFVRLQLSQVRGYITRIQVIRDTEYLAAAHPILRLFHVAIVASLILCVYPTVSLSYVVVGVRVHITRS